MKEGEADEEKFEQQSIIMKEEIKFLNRGLKVLDEVAVELLKGKEISK